ncbi:hypothetical protein O7635_30875 [Asanoa sp. WMMD1127]|uniref:hypothetical protein n=1 Tax=Asanoa sp. WMMD1127 TaxID=3016107 RepID=UPI00241641F9|nr:hypothetical protein [Asanoa sp. WMMD1127]MDG4826276.1 hypothetical protein [Asanoa sp. WMMD1127]
MSASLFSDPAITSAPVDLGEAFTVSYSVDGGAFTTLESARTATGAASFDLPASVEGRDLRLRFALDASSPLETLTVDNVLIAAGDGEEPPGGSLPPVADVTRAGPYAVTVDRTAGPGNDGWLVHPTNLGQNGVDHPIFVWTRTPARAARSPRASTRRRWRSAGTRAGRSERSTSPTRRG